MIVGIVGNLGSGKTLSATAIGYYIAQKVDGGKVLSNYHTSFTDIYVENPVQLNKMSKRFSGIQMLDEIWSWMDSRKSGQNDTMTEMVINSRKRGWIVIWTAQNADMVDKRLRNNSDWIVLASHESNPVEGDTVTLYIFNRNTKELSKLEIPAEPFYDVYDTAEEVSSDTREQIYEEYFTILKGNKEDCTINEPPEQKNEARSHLVARHGAKKMDAAIAVDEFFREHVNDEDDNN